MEQFFTQLEAGAGLTILDLAGASQANINFITSRGHRLYSEDVIQLLEMSFGDGDFYVNQCNPERMEEFLQSCLGFPDSSFDGVLIWDVLEFLAPPLLTATVDRLWRIMKPRGYLLALFHTETAHETVPVFYYRIADAGTLLLTPRGLRRPAQLFNSRAIERLFQKFESVKFFLTRDNLREVIVKR